LVDLSKGQRSAGGADMTLSPLVVRSFDSESSDQKASFQSS